MPRHHLIRCLIAILLVGLFLTGARAGDDRLHQRVPVDLAWSPCPGEDADGNPLAPAVEYVVWASREGTAPVAMATVERDTTCTLKFYPGSTYRVRVVGYDAQGRASEPSDWSDPIFPDLPTTQEPTAPDQFGSVLARDQLDRAFADLSVEQRAVIVLRHFLDLKREDVAEALGVPVGTVDSRLGRAMAKLRDTLQTEEPRSPGISQEVAR